MVVFLAVVSSRPKYMAESTHCVVYNVIRVHLHTLHIKVSTGALVDTALSSKPKEMFGIQYQGGYTCKE